MKKITGYIILFFLASCTYDKPEVVPDTGYPQNVENILVKKCATSGCHNSASRSNAAGLDFSTWDLMFEGGRNGSSVIPYSVDYSFMLYTINTDSTRAPVLRPQMPYEQPALSEEEYQTLHQWIADGAPDKNGFVKYSDDPNRKKFYVCMQGCDKVAVIDAKSKTIMRYINVGMDPNAIEAPHMVRVSPDGQYWYIVFIQGSYIQKFRTTDDSLIASLDIGSNDWNTIIITPDGKKGFVNATLAQITKVVDLEHMSLPTFSDKSYNSPHGGFITADGHYMYLTAQSDPFITKIDLTTDPFYDEVSHVDLGINNAQPHEAMLSPDGTKYFVSCQGTSEVRVFQTSNDSLIKVLTVGNTPQEFAVSLTHPYIFVTCKEGPTIGNHKGMVYVINYNTDSIVATVYSGFQPHGIAVDDEEGLVYVTNLNYDPTAPAPHHVTTCAGRNGNLSIIDMNTLQLYRKTFSDGASYDYKNELLVFPYFISIRN